MKQELQDLFEALPIGVISVDQDHRIRYANKHFSKFVAYPKPELQGLSILEITDSFDHDELKEGLRALFAQEEFSFELETRYQCKGGGYVWGYPVRMLHPSPDPDERDTVLMFVVDITERRRLEQQMQQVERLHALGLLASSVAHDFRNILTVVKTFADLLEARPDDQQLITQSIESVRSASDRGEQLTDQLLNFGSEKIETIQELETVDLNRLLREVVRTFSELLPPEIGFNLSLSNNNTWVRTDTGRLHQIVMNLILNARDAISDRGTITVETKPISRADLDLRDNEEFPPGDYVLLRVCDTGKGISAEQMPHLFEAFFTTKGEAGTGMGLTTVYNIVQEEQGHIEVESEPGKGSCFEVFLPSKPS